MGDGKSWARDQTSRLRDFYNVYTRGFSAEEFQRLFTRDTRDAYRYFSRGIDRSELGRRPWWKRPIVFFRGFFLAVTMKMSPARRVLFALSLLAGVIGSFALLEGFRTAWIPLDPIVLRVPLPAPIWPPGTGWLILSLVGLVLLVLLEVFERLSLKNDLEIARDIQQAMLPRGLYASRRARSLRRDAPGQHRRRRLLRHPAPSRRPGRRRAGRCGRARAARRRC